MVTIWEPFCWSVKKLVVIVIVILILVIITAFCIVWNSLTSLYLFARSFCRCISCPKGNYIDSSLHKCIPCPKGSTGFSVQIKKLKFGENFPCEEIMELAFQAFVLCSDKGISLKTSASSFLHGGNSTPVNLLVLHYSTNAASMFP